MVNATDLELKCVDFLKDNKRLYAHKARRKKISLIQVEVRNNHRSGIRIQLDDSHLISGNQSLRVEKPSLIIRKFSEFTWDFLLWLILDFHPILSAIDLIFLLCGPLYNGRLKRQLRLLTDGELILKSGETKKILLGFRGLTGEPEQLKLVYDAEGVEKREVVSDIE